MFLFALIPLLIFTPILLTPLLLYGQFKPNKLIPLAQAYNLAHSTPQSFTKYTPFCTALHSFTYSERYMKTALHRTQGKL